MKIVSCRFLLLALISGSAALPALADYQSDVLAQSPVGYWRLNETTQPPIGDVATNRGSLGPAATGYYLGTAVHPGEGALAGSTDAGAWFDGTSGCFVGVPISTGLMPSSAFTVEFWTKPNTTRPDDAGLLSPVASLFRYTTAPANNANGWIFYQAMSGWQFRLGSSAGYQVQLTGTTDPVGGMLYHVVGVFDGANATLYVNGVQEATAALSGAYQPNLTIPLGIGGRGDNAFLYDGMLDEVAIYPAALSATQIQAHYQNGISATPATPYDQLVLSANPLAYYRLNEPAYTPPATLPTAANLGSSGAAGAGAYNPGIQAGAPGSVLAGFGAANFSGGLNGVAGSVTTTATLNDLAKFTVLGWLKRGSEKSVRGGYFGQNDLLEFGDADGGSNIEAWINAYNTNIKIPYPFADNEWGFITLVGDGTKVVLYTNAIAAATKDGVVDTYGSSAYLFNIGGGGIFNATGDVFRGNVDEVAIFDKALTAEQIMNLFIAAGLPPRFSQQPLPPDRVLYEGSAFTLSATVIGTPPLTYQWRKNGSDVQGANSASLAFASLKMTDSGNYDLVVRNDYGSVTSSVVTLEINAVDATPPTLMYATANRGFNQVRVWFSEPVDPATAQNTANYQLSGGLTISSATLSAPAGNPGDNIVDLVTSTQTPGTLYTLTVNGVKDQITPGNTIAPNSTIQFSSWTLASGYLRFEHWDGFSGNTDGDIETALASPRLTSGTPTTEAMISGRFDTETVFTDDTHENYLVRVSGWLTPTESGDYYFFLRSDDASRLYLSANDQLPNPAFDAPIATEPDCCNSFYEPDAGDPSTTPTAIPLVAGQRYGILALLKEGTGGDHLQVAWRKSTDNTPATALPYLPGRYLSTYVDPNTDLAITQQPVDQGATLPSAGIEVFSRDFNANDGGFTATNSDPAPPGPWTYDSASGTWLANGGESDCTGPYNSLLNSPAYVMLQDGTLSLSFNHRYSFEGDRWDAGQVRISVNGGAFTLVPADNFTANGYAPGLIQGSGIANGQRAFNGDSPGYATGQFITSKAVLGSFSKGDSVVVQFAGAWDDCTTALQPGWVIDSMKIDIMPMIIQDFSKTNGAFTVVTSTNTLPGPWTYVATNGQWVANGGSADCTGPYNSILSSPAFVVPQTDEVTLNFTHRYSFESGQWDAGQVRVSVNGGPFTPVPAASFSANGYAPGVVEGTGILNGQPGFNGDSPGYSTNGYITSSAVLGTFSQNDTIALQFIGAWDECTTASIPGWAIKNLQLVFGKAAKASTFNVTATASKQGTPVAVAYQWQRNDGAGFVDILNANTPAFSIYPTQADLAATFRVLVSVPGKALASSEVKLVEGAIQTPEIGIQSAGGVVTITFTGKLQSATTANGPYNDVQNATSPYVVPNTATGSMFFRATR